MLPILLLSSCASPQGASEREFHRTFSECPDDSLRLVTFNIHAMRGLRRPDSQQRLVDFLKNSDADIIFLQEVDQGTQRSLGRKQLSFLQENTQFPYSYFASAIPYQGGEYGIGILSKHVLAETQTIKLDIDPKYQEVDYEPRVALHAKVQLNGKTIHAINTHLHYMSKARDAQWTLLRDKIIALLGDGNPLILAGDFNATQESPLIRDANALLDNTWKKDFDPATSPIDYIFTSRFNEPCSIERSGRGLSDHLAYLIEASL